MARTAQQQLDAIDTLIAVIEASPNFDTTIDGVRYTKHQLFGLYAERRRLTNSVSSATAGGNRNYARFDR